MVGNPSMPGHEDGPGENVQEESGEEPRDRALAGVDGSIHRKRRENQAEQHIETQGEPARRKRRRGVRLDTEKIPRGPHAGFIFLKVAFELRETFSAMHGHSLAVEDVDVIVRTNGPIANNADFTLHRRRARAQGPRAFLMGRRLRGERRGQNQHTTHSKREVSDEFHVRNNSHSRAPLAAEPILAAILPALAIVRDRRLFSHGPRPIATNSRFSWYRGVVF